MGIMAFIMLILFFNVKTLSLSLRARVSPFMGAGCLWTLQNSASSHCTSSHCLLFMLCLLQAYIPKEIVMLF